MRYWPVPSVTADRTFSISAWLEASTVTPGRTPPDESFTVPVIDPCADAPTGMPTPTRSTTTSIESLRMLTPDVSTRLANTDFLIPTVSSHDWRRLVSFCAQQRSGLLGEFPDQQAELRVRGFEIHGEAVAP